MYRNLSVLMLSSCGYTRIGHDLQGDFADKIDFLYVMYILLIEVVALRYKFHTTMVCDAPYDTMDKNIPPPPLHKCDDVVRSD